MPTLTPEALPSAFADWARFDLADPAPRRIGGIPAALVAFKGRVLAIGTVVYSCCAGGDLDKHRGVVWSTRDGMTWRLHDPIESLKPAVIVDAVTDGARIVAVGHYGPPVTGDDNPITISATWASSDGQTWVRSTGLSPSLVAAGPNGFIGVVTNRATDTSQFVRSQDGLVWTFTSDVIAAEVRGLAVDAAGHAVALGVVEGELSPDLDHYDDTVVIRSPDGLTWSPPELIVRRTGASAGSLGVDARGFVAVLTDQVVGGSVLWRITMTEAVGLPLVVEADEYFWEILAADETLIASGHGAGERVVWISLDGGASWGRVSPGPSLGGDVAGLAGAVVSGDRLIVVGHRHAETFHVLPVVWLADR